MRLRERFEQNPLGAVVIIAAIVATSTWAVLDQVLVRPRDEEFARLQRRMEELESREQARPVAPIAPDLGQNNSTTKAVEDNETPASETPMPQSTQSPAATDSELIPLGQGVTTPEAGAVLEAGGSAPVQVQSQDTTTDGALFQTESYRLTVDSVENRGVTVGVTLLIESDVDDIFYFGLSHPYLVDSQGTRLDLDRNEPAAFGRGDLEVLPRTKMRKHLSFCVMSGPTIGGFYGKKPACVGKQIHGNEFTLAASEVSPRRGRKIVLKVTE